MQQIRPDISTMRRLRPLSQFTDEQLMSLANHIVIETAVDKQLLIKLGCLDDFSLYVLNGEIKSRARDGVTKQQVFSDTGNLNPVAQLRPSMYDITAVGTVHYLKIAKSFLTEFAQEISLNEGSMVVLELEGDIDTNPLVMNLYQDLFEDKISLPSLPEVAQRIQRVFSDEDVEVSKITEVLLTDPAITAKLIKIANSPVYQGVAATNTLQAAIVRLGMDTTYKQVMAYAVNELFKSSSSVVTQRMSKLLSHSRKVAAISRLLAKKTGMFDPEQAMLAGLTHDLGVLVIVEYFHKHSEHLAEPEKMEQAIASMRPMITGQLMRKWNFSNEVIAVAEECEDWFRNPDDSADLCDLIIVAQYHSLMGSPDLQTMPPISIIPAMSKLKIGIQDSIDLIKQSNRELSEIERILV